MLSRCFLDFSVDVGFFCQRTESDLVFFVLVNQDHTVVKLVAFLSFEHHSLLLFGSLPTCLTEKT